MSNAAYLSIIEWPDHLSERERAAALAGAIGSDEYTAMLAVRRGTPQVACKFAADRAPAAVDALRAHGAIVFAPSGDALDALPEPTLVKRLVPGRSHHAEIEPWRGESFTLDAGEMALLVLGKVQSVLVAGGTSPGASDTARVVRAVGGAMLGMPLGLGSSGGGQPTQHTTDHMVTVLDAWLPLRRLRFISNRLDTEALSALAAPGARFDLAPTSERVDLLSRWFARAGPPIDRGFRDFHCPPDVLVTTTSTSSVGTVKKRTDEGPLFESYSRWASMLYNELRARG